MKLDLSHPIAIPPGSQLELPGSGNSADISASLPGYAQMFPAASPEDFLILPDRMAVTPTRRLVVLIPEGDFDENALAHSVWGLASTAASQVLFLALSPNQEGVAYFRRRLVTIAALTAFGEVRTGAHILVGKSWARAVAGILQAGDLLVCLEGHQVPFRIFGRKSLGELLSNSLNVPVYAIGGLHAGPSPFWISRIKEFSAWLASFAMIAVFAGVQIWIDRAVSEPNSTILICLSVALEIYLILKANEWIG